jgi:superfamily I DNA/RNA helicase/mRNA-degrading endonuclease RelE of RelBE toxin-antitoxin system
MTFEIIHKPTFSNQLLAIPQKQIPQILEKIQLLRDNPQPHGNVKKKLHGYQGNVYRLRSGDYRIIYTYGDRWVALLGVDQRKDVYKGRKLIAATNDSNGINVDTLPNSQQLLTTKPNPPEPTPTQTSTTPLPSPINQELLQRLRVPETYIDPLLACQTLEDLTFANIPDKIRDRIFDCISTPNFDEVLQQSDYITGDIENLQRYKEGDLLDFLLKLDAEQKKYVDWGIDASGPTLLKGSPGTGKSTVAIHRVKAMLESLQASGETHAKILFVTYTKALTTVSQQMLETLLGNRSKQVSVRTADSMARSLVSHCQGEPPNMADNPSLYAAIKKARSQALQSLPGNKMQRHIHAKTLNELSNNYLLEEINSVIEGREIKTLQDYQTTNRQGREIPLKSTQRQAIWHLRNCFYQQLEQQGQQTWQQLRTQAVEYLRTMTNIRRYDGVIVDEAQDLDPNALRMLVHFCQHPNRLFVTADANQSIYSNGFSWQDVHQSLKFSGRTNILRINHRTTQQIHDAACAYLQSGQLDSDRSNTKHVHQGPKPILQTVTDTQEELQTILNFFQATTKTLHLGVGSCAILTPTQKTGEHFAQQLNQQGFNASFMTSKEVDLQQPGIKILTLKAAKGLEFPIVAIAGFCQQSFPFIPPATPEDAKVEIYRRERRTLFVAMTRAMRALLLVVPQSNPGPLLQDFDAQLWELPTANPATTSKSR